jgi:hypothetical protein
VGVKKGLQLRPSSDYFVVDRPKAKLKYACGYFNGVLGSLFTIALKFWGCKLTVGMMAGTQIDI